MIISARAHYDQRCVWVCVSFSISSLWFTHTPTRARARLFPRCTELKLLSLIKHDRIKLLVVMCLGVVLFFLRLLTKHCKQSW